MKMLFLSWRDIKSPKSGGAEEHTHRLMQCFLREKIEIVHFSPLYEGVSPEEIIDGIKYLRKGSVFSVIRCAKRYYFHHKNTIDFVVDQCNTHRFFTRFWVPSSKRIFYIHQLTREIWDINLPFPFSWIGKHLETAMLRLQRHDRTITVSKSTKQELIDVGFHPERIFIINNAADSRVLGRPLSPIEGKVSKEFIFAGRYSRYKGIDASVEALGIAKRIYKEAKLHIIGKRDEIVVHDVIRPIAERYSLSYGSSNEDDVVLHGFVSEDEKYDLMERSRALLFPSIREGWGIIVTEAAALGTPSIVYNTPGCRDAVDYGNAGYLCAENTPNELARIMIRCIEDEEDYRRKREESYLFAQNFSWEKNQEQVNKFIEYLQGQKESYESQMR